MGKLMYVIIRFNCTIQLVFFFLCSDNLSVGSCLNFQLIIAYAKKQMIMQTFTPTRSVGSTCRERAVSAEVIFAINIAMIMRPSRIQMMEKIRATIDFGALSPYLKQKEIKPPLIYDIII